MTLTKKQIISFQKKILSWWSTHRRDLPWRRTRDPYRIMVSEVMLQQTQVLRVLPKYAEFIGIFPTVLDLAQATPAQVLRIWKGMGYNRRALYLHRAARIIASDDLCVIPANAGIQRINVKLSNRINFPKSERELRKLPGLGIYTARAILVFAYGQEIPLVDTNIRQIITHFFFHDGEQKDSIIEAVARQLIPPGKSWDWHQALMDYGAIAMSKLKTQSSKVKKKAILFRESNRFYRGRIIDRLREEDLEEDDLIKEFQNKYPKPLAFYRSILHGLKTDGLVSRSKAGIISLPE